MHYYTPHHIVQHHQVMEVPAFVNNSLDQDYLYPYNVESNSGITCEQQNLNIKHLTSQSKVHTQHFTILRVARQRDL